MYVIQEAKQQIVQAIKTSVGQGYAPTVDDLVQPPDSRFGDIAFSCFTLAQKLKRDPSEIATEIAVKIGSKGFIAQAKAHGPYVNFFFNISSLGASVFEELEESGEKYGGSDIGKDKRVMVEYANLNTHKDVHIGHLRNLFVGQTIVNLFKAVGFDVIPVAYINDLGLHVAKSIWAIKTFHKDETVDPEHRIEFLRDVYLEANKAEEGNPALKRQISTVFQHLESARGDEVEIWKETRKWSLTHLKNIYKELGLKIDHWYFESSLVSKTKKIIDGLIKKKIVVESQGAWIVDLQNEGLGVNLLIKSDGTMLYNAKDLGLAMKKEEDYHPARSIYVVDARQSHALAQLFATLKRMGFDHELTHLSYEFVTLEEGAMASRKGNVIRYETFRDGMVEEARNQTRTRHTKWDEKKIDRVSRAVAFAAIRFGMLKQDLDKKICFNMSEALSFDGFTGPYLLYTFARVSSILKKAGKAKISRSSKTLIDEYSRAILVLIANYPDVLFRVSTRLQPSLLAQYLFDLAKAFSTYYEYVPVLQSEKEELGERLALVSAVGQVLENGLAIFGIETVKEM